MSDAKSDCIFCRIADGEIPATIVRREDDILAFRDLSPQAPQHVLIIPKRHIRSVDALAAADSDLVGRMVLVAARIAREEGLDRRGYRLVVNMGEDGGQSVDHLHLHLIGGRRLLWPPG